MPQWYQDEAGTRVALCDDQNDPLCVLPTAPEGTYDPALPMSFPGNFPSELFWWNADAGFDTTNSVTNGTVSVTEQTDLFAVSGKEAPGSGGSQLTLSSTVAPITPGRPASVTLTNIGQAPANPAGQPAGQQRVEHRLVSADGYRFRVRATDAAGNTGDRAATSVHAAVVQDRSEKVRYDGRWVRRTAPRASGHRVRSSATRGATATIRTRAETVDVVAPTGPRRGRFAVLVDGRRVDTVDLYSSRPRPRQTVATVQGVSPQQASVVQLRVLGTRRHVSGGSRVTLDAFLLTR